MANGDMHGISWQWIAVSLMAIVTSAGTIWARLVSGKVAGHSERLARVEEICSSLKESNKELKARMRDANSKLDRLIERG